MLRIGEDRVRLRPVEIRGRTEGEVTIRPFDWPTDQSDRRLTHLVDGFRAYLRTTSCSQLRSAIHKET